MRASRVALMSFQRTPPPLCASVLDTIGNTPLVELPKLGAMFGGRVLAKLEYFNPGASKKDRIAKQIIEDAEQMGDLSKGQTVVELTSGNAGTGLAIVCGALGYPFVAVMSRGNSVERRVQMAALGARVELVDQHPDSVPGQVSGDDLQLVEHRTQELVEELGAFRADQFFNQSNFRAHLLHTGPELWEQAEGRLDAFVDFIGSGGSLAGIGHYLKYQSMRCLVFGAEPAGAMVVYNSLEEDERGVLLGDESAGVLDPSCSAHGIQGGGYSMLSESLPLLHNVRHVIDGFVGVTTAQAVAHARLLAEHEGIYGGFSTGANLYAARQFLESPEGRGKTVAFLACDSGLKYGTTSLYD